MTLVLDVRRPDRRRRSPYEPAPAVSVLRWRSGPSNDGVYEMFGAREAGRFRSPEAESRHGTDVENVLLVSASRRTAPDVPAVLLSLVNSSASQAVRLSVRLAGRTPTSMTGTILTPPPTPPRKRRSRAESDAAKPACVSAFRGSVLKGKVVEITVPPTSVVVLTLKSPARG